MRLNPPPPDAPRPPCWSCAAAPGEGPFCQACGKIQPARPRNLFSVLGLETHRYHLEPAAIEKAQRDLSRRLHPDKFAKADARERRFALEQTTQVNEAVKTLKDPVRRAEYLLRTLGFALATDETGRPGAGEALPLEFYEEVMADREALLEARLEGPEAVERLVTRVVARRDETLALIDEAFDAWEEEGAPQVVASAVNDLAKLRYYARFLEEVEGRAHD